MSYLYFREGGVAVDVNTNVVTEVTPRYLDIKRMPTDCSDYSVAIYSKRDSEIDWLYLEEEISLNENLAPVYETDEATGEQILVAYDLNEVLELKKPFVDGWEYLIQLTCAHEEYSRVEAFNLSFKLTDVVVTEGKLIALPYNHDGYIDLILETSATGTIEITFLRRKAGEEDYLTLCSKTIETSDSTGIVTSWLDYSAESGIAYDYACTVNGGEQIDAGEAATLDLEDIFLCSNGQVLKIKFNPTISGFKRNYKESFVETLGARYPFSRRSGAVDYCSFTLGGLISLEGSGARPLIELDPALDDFTRERQFREAVMNFLHKNNIKLFKSATEGNLLVKLTNVSFTPEQKLGRMIYSFSCTATEMMEPSVENILSVV